MQNGKIVLDPMQEMAGRGAYLCKDGCFQKVILQEERLKQLLSRAFKKNLGNLDFRGLIESNGKNQST